MLVSHGFAPDADLVMLTDALARLGWDASVEEVSVGGAGRRRHYLALATRPLPSHETWPLPRRTMMRAKGTTAEEALAGVLAKAFRREP